MMYEQFRNHGPDNHRATLQHRRTGFTLIELLVVVAILAMLVGISAAVIQPLREGRDIREAARAINAYLAAAQARAMSNGPVGVWVNRLSSDPNDPRSNMALELVAAEVPPPYNGDFIGSFALFVAEFDQQKNYGKATLFGVSGISDPPESTDLVHVGDYIKFGYQGPLRRIDFIGIPDGEEDEDEGVYEIEFTPTIDFINSSTQVPFQIYRFARPARASVAPLVLPPAVAIDIGYSGIGATDKFFHSGANPAILFWAIGAN